MKKQNKNKKKKKSKTKKKQTNKKKKTDPHKESRAKKEEKGKDNENLQDMCKNHQGLQQEKKKKKRICKIHYLWVTVTPDICQILQEKPNGKLKMVYCFVWRNNVFKFEKFAKIMLQARNG